MLTSTERVILSATVRRVNYYREQNFDKYVILEYVDSAIIKVRGNCSDELLRCLFDVRQQVVLGKEIQKEMENSMKEENIRDNYETIDTVKQRDLLETTRNLGRLLTEEEFDGIMMVYKKVIDRLWNELEKLGNGMII